MTGRDDGSDDGKRRDFLKALGATGIAGVTGFAGSAGATAADRTLVEVTGTKAERLATVARGGDDYRALRAALESRAA